MRYAVDPRQTDLFDPADSMFSPMTLKVLRGDWPGLFRAQMLHLMPAGKLGRHFHPSLGCPTKELYGMAGVIFLKGFFNLGIEETVRRYLTDAAWQYALNVNPMEASLSHATVERYTKLFVEDDLAAEVFHRVTSALVETLELDVSRQRLDSTHVFSDMATFGRTKLMGVSIKRFLTQLKRHHHGLYDALPEALRSRYAPSQGKLFADFKGQRRALRQTVAEDLLALVSQFAGEEAVASRSSYKAMKRILEEQCDVVEERVALKDKPGGSVMQNPSDPDAAYDGHKGPGHQAQLAETCGEDNDVQLITGVIPEPADRPDQDALEPMLDQLEAHGRLPEAMYSDTHYGSDENVTLAAERGVDLQSPVSGTSKQDPDALTVDDFVIDEASETVERCPNGCEPVSSAHDAATGVTTTVMRPSECHGCDFASQCPVRNVHGRIVLRHTAKQRRLAARRAEQATDAFRDNYAIRGGGESVNSGLKRKMGMGRLRVRGSPRVRMAVLL
ncbi:MAG: transposase, partial [Candidatus Brocadiae bacterium]|nr:transposase [Candidatus Brocadiia bacterium]